MDTIQWPAAVRKADCLYKLLVGASFDRSFRVRRSPGVHDLLASFTYIGRSRFESFKRRWGEIVSRYPVFDMSSLETVKR